MLTPSGWLVLLGFCGETPGACISPEHVRPQPTAGKPWRPQGDPARPLGPVVSGEVPLPGRLHCAPAPCRQGSELVCVCVWCVGAGSGASVRLFQRPPTSLEWTEDPRLRGRPQRGQAEWDFRLLLQTVSLGASGERQRIETAFVGEPRGLSRVPGAEAAHLPVRFP